MTLAKNPIKPNMNGGDAFGKKQAGMLATTTAAECNEYLRTLNKQLMKVLKNKPSRIPSDVGVYSQIFFFWVLISKSFYYIARKC